MNQVLCFWRELGASHNGYRNKTQLEPRLTIASIPAVSKYKTQFGYKLSDDVTTVKT